MEMELECCLIAAADKSSLSPTESLLSQMGVSHISYARTAAEVLERLSAFPTDILVADAVLPGADAVSLARDILSLPLRRYPAMVFLTLPGFFADLSELHSCGAAVIEKPLLSGILVQTLAAIRSENRSLPPEKANALNAVLSGLGIPDHPGRAYLFDAAALVWMDERYFNSRKDHLYPAIGRKYGCTSAHVERSMRYAIDHAWRTGDMENQHRVFGDTIDARRGKPTCGEMIARLAGILRWEGKR